MPVQVDISPQDIEELVESSIMASGFGAAVTKAIQSVLEQNLDLHVRESLEEYVKEVCKTLLADTYADNIHNAVVATIEVMIQGQMVQGITAQMIEKIQKAAI